MKVQYQEGNIKLSSLTAGQVAVSVDRKQFFICGYVFKDGANQTVILNVNDLSNQYTDKVDMDQPVHVLKGGDQFHCRA